MRESYIEDMGLRIGGRNITNLRYADDTGLIASNVTTNVRKVDAAGEAKGLGLNAPKTKYTHIKWKDSQADEHNIIKVKGTQLEKSR